MWRNGMKTPTRKLLTWYLVNFLWYHYAMLGTKLILNYVKAHHRVKKSFFTHSPSILFSVFQDLETTAQGMNQVRLKVDIKHVWAKSPALNKLHKSYTACGAGCKKRVFTFLKWVWRHLVDSLGDFTRLVGCFRLIQQTQPIVQPEATQRWPLGLLIFSIFCWVGSVSSWLTQANVNLLVGTLKKKQPTWSCHVLFCKTEPKHFL